jgi:hypothetical protein
MFQQVELYLVPVHNVLKLLDMLFYQLFVLFDVYIDEIDLDEDDKDKFEATKKIFFFRNQINKFDLFT